MYSVERTVLKRTYCPDPVERLVSQCNGNPFAACNIISKKASWLVRVTSGTADASEGVTWAITGKLPNNLKKRMENHMKLESSRTPYMVNLLSYVDDDDVLEAVKQSYDQSVSIDSLTFYYPVKMTEGQKSRVRVLTRMCWENR